MRMRRNKKFLSRSCATKPCHNDREMFQQNAEYFSKKQNDNITVSNVLYYFNWLGFNIRIKGALKLGN